MNDFSMLNENNYEEIIRINHKIREDIYEEIQKFLILKNELMEKLRIEQIDENPIIENNAKFFETTQIEHLNQQIPSRKLPLALVGNNSCGKTSFLHYLLRSENFLPIDIGPITARIIRLTYTDAKHAALYVYHSLTDQQIHCKIELNKYFLNLIQPDWNGIRIAIAEHITRPDPKIIHPYSDEFADWAKYFVEIRLPSPFLKLGIDLYDTPGLLFSDAPILKTNLYQLVKLIKPTLIFMYDNPSITSDTRDCFLAIKQAIGSLSHVDIFFLNTKVDIETIIADADPDQMGIDDEQLSNIILQERQKRYELLRNISSIINEFPQDLPQSIQQCSCFDIISIYSDFDPLGSQLNIRTLNRLIEFTSHVDLRLARKLRDNVLPMIDTYFDLVFTSHHRTLSQFDLLLTEALQWTNYFYIEYKKLIEQFLDEFYENILKQIEDNLDEYAQRASTYRTRILIDQYMKTIFQQDIIKYQIRLMRTKYTNKTFLNQLIQKNLIKIAQKNEFLLAAQRQSNWLCQLNIHSLDKKSTQEIFAEQTILTQILLISDVFLESPDRNLSLSNYRQLFKRKPSFGKEINSLELAKERLNDICLWLIEQRSYMNEIIHEGYQIEKNEFIDKIHQFYQLAKQSIGKREKLYKILKNYSENFATIECRILCILNSGKNFRQIHSYQLIDNDIYIDSYGHL